jgi:hypothetical protein
MRCFSCGNDSHAPGALTCRVCGRPMKGDAGRPTARTASGWKDRTNWKRHTLVRVGSNPIELVAGTDWRIGRSSDCNLRIQSPRVSRHHAMLMWREGKPVLRDLESQAGVAVNGKPVREHTLADGDEVTIGPFTCTYRCLDGIGSLSEMQDLLDSQADTQQLVATVMSGRIAELGVFEVLETLGHNRKTGTLEVFGPWGDEGAVGLQDGEPLWARLDQMTGRAAIDAVLEWTEGWFRFTAALPPRPRDIEEPLLRILEDARSRSDHGLQSEDYSPPTTP